MQIWDQSSRFSEQSSWRSSSWLKCKYRIWKGNAEPKLAVPTVFTAAFWLLDAYYRVVSFLGLWTAYQNLQMAMNHKSLPCIPWEWKGEGAWSRLPAGPDHCGMLLGWAGGGMTSSCPWDVVDVITKACLAFFGTRSLTTQQPSCWEGSDICVKFFTGWDTSLSAKIKIIQCVYGRHFICTHWKDILNFQTSMCLALLLSYISPFI